MLISEVINAVLQVLVFSLIPFIIYLLKYKKANGFLEYIGIKKSPAKANILALLVMLLIAMPMLLLANFNTEFREILTGETTMIGKFKTMGFGLSSFTLLIIDAGIKTSLSEEIFFRGFLAKRLIAVSSFQVGNVIQALIFGLVHALLFSMITSNAWILGVMFLFPSIGAYFKTIINEKYANGSIIPGWITHGSGNMIAYSLGYFLYI